MNDPCPVCDMLFACDAGYFPSVMHFSYGMGIAIITSFRLLTYLVFPNWCLYRLVLLALGGVPSLHGHRVSLLSRVLASPRPLL
ncbi:MAG: hypothetical protein ABI353_09700 [Isosphaeraceae bacterium]